MGEFPTATQAEEIETPGHGQVRALVTLAGCLYVVVAFLFAAPRRR